MQLQKARIYNRLFQLGKNGTFYRVRYLSDGTMLGDLNENDKIAPKTVLVNETAASFDIPMQFRRYARRERSGWTWQLYLAFDKEVIIEAFEKELIEQAIILPYDKENKLQQVTLELVDSEYTHPVKREPASGTQVTLTFHATLGPV